MCLIPVSGKLRQEVGEFEVSQDFSKKKFKIESA
jgi:hypothetical protein